MNSGVDFSLIRFIDFDIFKELDSFPRCPELAELTRTLDAIERDTSLLIFISHCWMRPTKEVAGTEWDGSPHPDNAAGDKFRLCVKGIRWIWTFLASKMRKCYLWMDYSCIDQAHRSSVAKSVKCYDTIVSVCDAMFTPIVDNDISWEFEDRTSILEAYKAPLWRGYHNSYLDRAWCRVEMMYAANIPVLGNRNGVARHTLFSAALSTYCRLNRRAHFLFGSKEAEDSPFSHSVQFSHRAPHSIPPLQNSWFDTYNPLDGNISVESDRAHVSFLIENLMPIINSNKVHREYIGDRNDQGKRHGFGTFVDKSGNTYEGHWFDGKKDGTGIFSFYEGSVYAGEYKNDEMEGSGVYYSSCGYVYEGQYKNGNREGIGKYKLYSGDIYEGIWKNNEKNGPFVQQYNDGGKFVGTYENDERIGFGTYYFQDGGVYEGEWKHNFMNGNGTYRYNNGDVFEGMWKNDEKISGRISFTTGEVYEGEWNNGVFERKGKYNFSLGVYEGDWKKGIRDGFGICRYEIGIVYEGEWKNDYREGLGTLTFPDGSYYRGQWKNGEQDGRGSYHPVEQEMYECVWENGIMRIIRESDEM